LLWFLESVEYSLLTPALFSCETVTALHIDKEERGACRLLG
jgi:hypothetical protein